MAASISLSGARGCNAKLVYNAPRSSSAVPWCSVSEETTADHPGTVYDRGSCGAGGRLAPGVSQSSSRQVAAFSSAPARGESTLVAPWVPFNRIRSVATRRKMLKLCGETEEKLAQELIQFEFQIERDVVEPLCVIAEVRRYLPDTGCPLTLRADLTSPLNLLGRWTSPTSRNRGST